MRLILCLDCGKDLKIPCDYCKVKKTYSSFDLTCTKNMQINMCKKCIDTLDLFRTMRKMGCDFLNCKEEISSGCYRCDLHLCEFHKSIHGHYDNVSLKCQKCKKQFEYKL